MRLFGGGDRTPILGVVEGPNLYHRSGNPICLFGQLFGKTYYLATIHTLQTTDDRRTTGRATSATVSTIAKKSYLHCHNIHTET